MMDGDELQRALGRIEGKVDGINERLDGVNDRLNNHSKRLRVLEIWCYGVLTTIAGWFGWQR